MAIHNSSLHSADNIFRRILCLGLFLVFCSSCVGHSDYDLPFQSEEKFSESGTELLPHLWWQVFRDEQLNNHLDIALNTNFSLAAAWERLKAARAIARRAKSDLYPDLDLVGGVSREIDDGDQRDVFEIGPAASYEVDLWGKIHVSTAAADLRAEVSKEAYRTAALSLSSDIAITWIRLVEAHNRLKLLESQINTNKKALKALMARFGIGQVRSEDILRQQLLLEAVREAKITVESDMQTLEHQLAVLRGEAPQGKNYSSSGTLPVLSPLPDTGLAAELINRRPDVRAAYLEIEAADKDLAAAVRAQYPSLTLSASYISEESTAGNLFSNWILTLAGGVITPVLDGGERRAEVYRSEAVRSELINSYAETVLNAFQEVEDALIQEKKQRERISNLETRLKLARNTYDQILTGYFKGANEFISLLSAQDELQDIEQDLLRARRNLVEFRIALYRALAGGFQTPLEDKKIED